MTSSREFLVDDSDSLANKTLPNEVIANIFSYIPNQGLLSCLTFFNEIYEELYAKRLFELTLKGNQSVAEKMIKKYPNLLTIKSHGIDYSNRHIEGITSFQAALCMGDVEMWKMMEKHLSHSEKSKQIDELFALGITPVGLAFDFSVIANIITNSSFDDVKKSLRKEENNTIICDALNAFRSEFTKCSKASLFFNPHHLVNALTTYDAHYKIWNECQRDLFWRQVIGYVQYYLPACYASILCNGLFKEVDLGLTVARQLNLSQNFISPHNTGFFSSNIDKKQGLGFDYAIYAGHSLGYAGGSSHWMLSNNTFGEFSYLVSKLARSKQASLLDLSPCKLNRIAI